MRWFRDWLRDQGETVYYSSLADGQSYEAALRSVIRDENIGSVATYQPKDHFFTAVSDVCKEEGVGLRFEENPNFLTSREQLVQFFDDHSYHHHSFYKWQRRRLDILIGESGPVNGEWSFDEENRERLTDPSIAPDLPVVEQDSRVDDVKDLVAERFADHPGRVDTFWLPTTRSGAEDWLERFLTERFEDFGPYQDAINKDVDIGFHSVVSPMLNNGLLSPHTVVDRALTRYEVQDVHFPSVEGFIRQVIGWREFVRGVYETVDLRRNVFEHDNRLSDVWWTGATGLEPVDDVIEQSIRLGYAHHIQRLMVVSNAMLLCEAHPDDVYQWFMEFFVDSADWVMEPNVYDMGQYATGGVFATKPYVSSSNYIRKMSDYQEGRWSHEWDALYWSFLRRHRDKLSDNHRMGFMYSLLDKKSDAELDKYHDVANSVRNRLTIER